MVQQSEPVEQLPAACTLGPGRREEQRRRWRALDAGHLLHHTRTPTELFVHYRADTVSRRELGTLIDVELGCCGFLTWTVVDADDELAVVVRGPPAELDAFSAARSRPAPTGRLDTPQ